MSDCFIIRLPLRLQTKNKKTKKISIQQLSMNQVLRNSKFVYLNIKRKIKKEIIEEVRKLPKFKRIKLLYVIKASRGDLMNIGSILDKVFCDLLVEEKKLEDDSIYYIDTVAFKGIPVEYNSAGAYVKIYSMEG